MTIQKIRPYYLNTRNNTTKINFPIPKLSKPQYDFLFDITRNTLFNGAVGAGKTFIGTLKSILLACNLPGTNHLVAAYTSKMIKDSIYPLIFQHLSNFPSNLFEFRRFDAELTLWNGSRIAFRQLDDEGKARGPNYTSVYIDEITVGIHEGTFFQILARLREGNRQYFFTTTNPSSKAHYLYDYFFLPAERDTDSRRVITANIYDNKYNLPEEYIRELESRPENWRKRFLLGEWGTMEGLVFEHFDRNIHIDSLQYDPELDYFLAIDYGIDAPFACLLMAYDKPNRRFYVLKEHYKRGWNTNVHCEYIEANFIQYNPRFFIPDYQDKNAVDIMKRALGLRIKAPDKRRDYGFKKLQNYMLIRNDGKPGLIIDSSCKNLIREIESFEYKTNRRGESLEDYDKRNDHALDALRYGVATLGADEKPTRKS